MTLTPNPYPLHLSSRNPNCISFKFPSKNVLISQISRSVSPMATLSGAPTVGISKTFERLKEQGKVAFIPYIATGDLDMSTTLKALKVLDYCGSDIIELGMPFSDPLAYGPVIQAAATRALAKGINCDAIISMVVPQISSPIASFSYYHPILKHGVEKFMSAIEDAGVHGNFHYHPIFCDEHSGDAMDSARDICMHPTFSSGRNAWLAGLVLPDVPFEETAILRNEAANHNIELVLFAAPVTPIKRMKAIVKASEGFIYLVSSVGVTGTRSSVSLRVLSLLQEIKEATTKPVVVGFGISKPEHVKQVAGGGADGVIVGSAMVKTLGDAKTPEEGLKELEAFTKSLKAAFP